MAFANKNRNEIILHPECEFTKKESLARICHRRYGCRQRINATDRNSLRFTSGAEWCILSTMTSPRHTAKIGLALGSGGARGWAHLGVLRRLNELGIRPGCIAGTSAGAIAAALYASDSVETMVDLSTHLDWKQVAQLFLEVNFPRSGLLTGKNVMHLLKSVIDVRAVSSLRIPYAAVATDLETEKEVVLRSGNLFDAIRASIGIPGIFTPSRISGHTLVDGGLVNPLPVSVCRAMGADFVIAVDVNLRTATQTRKSVKRTQPPAPPQRIAKLIASLSNLMPQRASPVTSSGRTIASAPMPSRA